MSAKTRKEQIEELLLLDPDDSFLRYGLAMEFIALEQDQQAMEQFRDLLQRDPGYVPAYLQAGRALIRIGDDPAAKEMLRRGISVANEKGDTHAAGEMAGFMDAIG